MAHGAEADAIEGRAVWGGSLGGIVALELGARGRSDSLVLRSSAGELSLEISLLPLKTEETSPMLVVEAVGLGLEGFSVALVLVEFATGAIVFSSNVCISRFELLMLAV